MQTFRTLAEKLGAIDKLLKCYLKCPVFCLHTDLRVLGVAASDLPPGNTFNPKLKTSLPDKTTLNLFHPRIQGSSKMTGGVLR